MSQHSEPVDLGQMLHEPRDEAQVGNADSGRDFTSTESASPLSADRGGADPVNIGPGSVQTGFKGQ